MQYGLLATSRFPRAGGLSTGVVGVSWFAAAAACGAALGRSERRRHTV